MTLSPTVHAFLTDLAAMLKLADPKALLHFHATRRRQPLPTATAWEATKVSPIIDDLDDLADEADPDGVSEGFCESCGWLLGTVEHLLGQAWVADSDKDAAVVAMLAKNGATMGTLLSFCARAQVNYRGASDRYKATLIAEHLDHRARGGFSVARYEKWELEALLILAPEHVAAHLKNIAKAAS